VYQMLRLTIAAMAVIFASFPTSAPAQVPAATQLKLTEQHIEGFAGAQKDMSAVAEKMMEATVSKSANAKYKAELNAVIKKHGFKNFSEYQVVAANIYLVMASIDSQTKVFTDPPTAVKREIEDVIAAKDIPTHEKKKLLRSLTLALREARPIKFPANIRLVQKHYDQIIAASNGDSWRNSNTVQAE
jgi:hypothetical protein